MVKYKLLLVIMNLLSISEETPLQHYYTHISIKELFLPLSLIK